MTSTVLWFFAFSFSIFAIQSGDVFMYLALARDFLITGNWSTQDPYLYSLPGAQLVWQHEYLSYALYYAANWLGGTTGLIVLKALILGLTFRLVLVAGPKQANPSWLWIGLYALAVLAASFRFVERSSAISDLFALLLVKWLLENHQITRALLIRLSVLFFLWIQFHPGFPVGLGLLGMWSAWNLFFSPQFRFKDTLWLAVPVSFLFLNPLGAAGVIYPFQFALNEAEVLRHHNFEWFPSYNRTFRTAPEVISFWILSALCILVIAKERAWASFRTWTTVAAFVIALRAVRFIPWAAFVMIMSVKPWSTLKYLRIPWAAHACLLIAFTAIGIKNLSFGYYSSSGPRLPGFKIDSHFFPVQTLEVLRQQPIAGRVYNTHDFGAYMIWNGYRPIFHHGFVTDMAFYKNDVIGVFQSQGRFLELAAKHGWTMLLVEKKNSYAYFWKILSPLPEWKIVAEDEGSYLIYRMPTTK